MKFNIHIFTKKDKLAAFEIADEDVIIQLWVDKSTDITMDNYFSKHSLTALTHKVINETQNAVISTELGAEYLELRWENIDVSKIIEDGDLIKISLTNSGETLRINKEYFEIWMEKVWN